MKSSEYRVLRGGSWDGNVPSWVRAASRITIEPANRNFYLGFRCARVGSRRKVAYDSST